MENTYHVKVTEQAEEHLREIVRYITVQLKAPETALHFLDAFEQEVLSLSQFPGRFALVDEEPWHSQGVHKMILKNFLVYFLIDETVKKVQIFAVIYGGRDQGRQLIRLEF